MTVRQVVIDDLVYDVGGHGYEPSGDIMLNGQRVAPDETPGLSECLLAGLVCNDSALVRKEGRWDAQGDPTEVPTAPASFLQDRRRRSPQDETPVAAASGP